MIHNKKQLNITVCNHICWFFLSNWVLMSGKRDSLRSRHDFLYNSWIEWKISSIIVIKKDMSYQLETNIIPTSLANQVPSEFPPNLHSIFCPLIQEGEWCDVEFKSLSPVTASIKICFLWADGNLITLSPCGVALLYQLHPCSLVFFFFSIMMAVASGQR